MGEGDLSPFFKKKLYPISWTLLMASKFRDTFFCLHFLYVSSILNSQNEQNLLIREYLLLSLQILEKSLGKYRFPDIFPEIPLTPNRFRNAFAGPLITIYFLGFLTHIILDA